jgi:hypothetical protein
VSGKQPKLETSKMERMPNWTNFHNKEALVGLAESLKKNYQWNSTELLLLELLARFAKSVTVSVKSFFAAIPEKYLKNIPPNERQIRVNGFFEKLAEAGLCQVKHRHDEHHQIDTVILTQAETPEERKKKELVEPAVKYLRHYYGRRDFKIMLQNAKAHLPYPETLQEHTPLAQALLGNFYSTKIRSLIFSTKELTNPTPQFTQEIFNNAETPFMLIEFPGLTSFDSAKRHNLASAPDDNPEQPFSLVLPAAVNIKELMKDFFVPLILTYLQEEKNKDVYKTIHHEWSKKIHSSVAESQLDPEAKIDKTLLAADLNDGAYYASVHVLTHVLRHLKLRNLPAAPPLLIYEATRFIYDHAMACRQLLNLEKQRKAEQAKDQEIILNFLLKDVIATPSGATLPGPLPVEKKQIEELRDCSKLTTLGLKYRSVRDLMPLEATTVDQVPKVLEFDGKFLHRWHLVNYFLLMQHVESNQLQHRLAHDWSETAIPRTSHFPVPDDLVSAEFVRVVQLVHEYRSGAKIELADNQVGRQFDVFLHYFFPTPEQARAYQVEGLIRSSEADVSGAKGTRQVVRNEIDKTIYRDIRNFSLAPYKDMLLLTYSSIKKEAADLVRARIGTLGYFFFLLRGLFGSAQDSVPAAGKRTGPSSARRGGEPGRRPGSKSGAQASAAQNQKTIQELEEVLAKVPQMLRVEVDTLQFQVDPVIRMVNPDIRNMSDDEAKVFVKNFIAKTPKLNSLPFRSDPIFHRYVLLVMRRNNQSR